MSRGLGVLQREILDVLAYEALDLPDIYNEGYVGMPDVWIPLYPRTSANRRAANSLKLRGMLETEYWGEYVGYGVSTRRGEPVATERRLLHVRYPLERFDAGVDDIGGSDVDEHFTGLYETLSEARAEVQDICGWDHLRRPGPHPTPKAEKECETVRQQCLKSFDYHETRLKNLEVPEPQGWEVFYLRWRAHRAHLAGGFAKVDAV